MNEEIRLSRLRISRRRALGLGGTATLGAVLAACGSGDTSSGAGAASSPSASTSTSTSTAASASPSAAASAAGSADLVAALDEVRTCTASRDVTQGPYWFDVDAVRSDIREDRPGTPLRLAVRVQDTGSCSSDGSGAVPVANCVVEIWHCDAGGSYSGFESGSAGGGPGAGSGETSDGSYSAGDAEAATTDDGTYLRGAQVADANGIVQFTTIYPGWYRGRTVHIHLKVHLDKKTVLTTQLYFDEDVNDAVLATAPYSDHAGRDTTNAADSIYDESGLLTVSKREGDAVPYLALINLGVDV